MGKEAPATEAAHRCLDVDNKGDCTIDAAVEVVQEGKKVERKIIDSVERVKEIDGARRAADEAYAAAHPPSVTEVVKANLGLDHLSQQEFAIAMGIFGFILVSVVGGWFVMRRHA